MKLVFWGTYDRGKPRVRLLLEGARRAGHEVVECHREVWDGIEDKHALWGKPASALRRLARWLAAYPALLARYAALPAHDAVIVPYLGHVDVLALWPLARLRGAPVYWDAFLSLYDTVVEDRALAKRGSPLARALFALDWLACRAARPFLDTAAHARRFEALFGLAPGSVGDVPVGAETALFSPSTTSASKPFSALFYGQFIPLHGVETIARACALLERRRPEARWLVIGRGQQEAAFRALLARLSPRSLEWLPWAPYESLPARLAQASVGLGIFGATPKAGRVVPNKAFQILAARRPLITADTPAMRAFARPGPWVRLVPPGDPEALALEVERLLDAPPSLDTFPHEAVVGPEAVGARLTGLVEARA